MLAHLVSFENENLMKIYKEIRKELAKYDKKLVWALKVLSSKQEIIILTKTDVVEKEKI